MTSKNMFSFRYITTTAILGITLVGMLCLATPAHAAETKNDYGLKATAGAAGLSTDASIPSLTGKIIGAGLSLMGIVFLGLMLYGGFMWMTARGDTQQVTKARDAITNAVIGFAIVAGAYAITDFVVNTIAGSAAGGGAEGGVDNTAAQQECLTDCNNQAFDDQDGVANCAQGCRDQFPID